MSFNRRDFLAATAATGAGRPTPDEDPPANQLLRRDYREPWKYPEVA